MVQFVPKNYRCTNCGREQYTKEKCYGCNEKSFISLEHREKSKLILKHGELGGLKENAEVLWKAMNDEIKKNGYSDTTFIMEGTAKAIFEIIDINNIAD